MHLSAPVVLMYHSVCRNAGRDLFNLHVDPERFEAQIATLAATYQIVSLTEIGRDIGAGSLRPNTLAVTFDDGYANNLSIAAPVLQKFNVPATLFICTGFLGRDAFWWDQLVNIIFGAVKS